MFKAALPNATPVKNGRRVFPKIKNDHTAADDLIAVNPGWQRALDNGDKSYTHNCQRCVPTYEMRRRGYDVVAKPRVLNTNGEPDNINDPMAFSDAFKGMKWKYAGQRRCKQLMQDWGDGARAEVHYCYRNKKGDVRAHVFVAENRGGEVVYIDPQTGKDDVRDYFTKSLAGYTKIARIDNLEPSDLIDECCTSRKGAGS